MHEELEELHQDINNIRTQTQEYVDKRASTISNNTNKTIITSQEHLLCPKCGAISLITTDPEKMNFMVVPTPPYQGVYCLQCYGAWVANNIPAMEVVKPTKGKE